MKKLIFLMLAYTSFAIAEPIILNTPQNQQKTINKIESPAKVNKQEKIPSKLVDISPKVQSITLAEPIKLNLNNDLAVTENLINEDIELNLTNQTAKALNIKYIAYNINGNICAENKSLQLSLQPKKSKAGYYVAKADLANCYLAASKIINGFGNFKFIDVSSKISHAKYREFNNGLLLLPLEIIIKYNYGDVEAIKYNNTYLVYTKS